MQDDLKVWHCRVCAESQMEQAAQKMAARSLRAQEKARQQKHIRQYVAGWLPAPCGHTACEPRTVTQDHYDALHGIERPRKRPLSDDAYSFRDLAARMSEMETAPEHVQAAQRYDAEKLERDARAADEDARKAGIRREEGMAKSAARQRASWNKNLAEGRIPVHRPLGKRYTREMHDNMMAGREPYVPYEMLASFHVNSVRSAMDVFSYGIVGKDRIVQAFLQAIRRTEMGLMVDWLLPDHFDPDVHRRFEISSRNAPFLDGGDENGNDLPLDWYDGGDSKAWKQKQKQASWGSRATKDSDKNSVGNLLMGIGRRVPDSDR